MDLDPEDLWINRVVETDDSQSWYELNETLRRWFAQRWISSNPQALKDPAAGSRTRDELVDVLAGPVGDDNGLFPYMWRVTRRYILEALGPLLGEELSAGTRPRTVAPGIEAVPIFRASDLPGYRDFIRSNPAQHTSRSSCCSATSRRCGSSPQWGYGFQSSAGRLRSKSFRLQHSTSRATGLTATTHGPSR